jgi:hypothetical protein
MELASHLLILEAQYLVLKRKVLGLPFVTKNPWTVSSRAVGIPSSSTLVPLPDLEQASGFTWTSKT